MKNGNSDFDRPQTSLDLHGHCVACGIEWLGQKNFLCENCVNPAGGMVVCPRCRTRRLVSLEELRLRAEGENGVPTPVRPGVVIALPFCQNCERLSEPTTLATVYVARFN